MLFLLHIILNYTRSSMPTIRLFVIIENNNLELETPPLRCTSLTPLTRVRIQMQNIARNTVEESCSIIVRRSQQKMKKKIHIGRLE